MREGPVRSTVGTQDGGSHRDEASLRLTTPAPLPAENSCCFTPAGPRMQTLKHTVTERAGSTHSPRQGTRQSGLRGAIQQGSWGRQPALCGPTSRSADRQVCSLPSKLRKQRSRAVRRGHLQYRTVVGRGNTMLLLNRGKTGLREPGHQHHRALTPSTPLPPLARAFPAGSCAC